MPVLYVALGLQFLVLLVAHPMATLRVTSPGQLLPFRVGVLCGAGLFFASLLDGRSGRLAWWGVLGTHFLLGLWVLRAMPQPGVDVCLFQREAARALLGGHNPYAASFPNLYSDAGRVYGPGTFAGDKLLFGFPYPPLSLLMILPGQVLGDFRLSHLLATTAAGALIAASRPGRIATAAGALFLFTPRAFFVLEAGWTEPLGVLLFAMVVYFALRPCRGGPPCPPKVLEDPGRTRGSAPTGSRRNETEVDRFATWGLALSLALLLVVKQYMILIVPLAVWWVWPVRGRMLRPIIVALVVVACLSLPIAAWNLRAFLWSVLLLQFHQPVRPDALSFLPSLLGHVRMPGATALPFALAAGVIAWTVLRFSRTPCAFAGATALMFLLFFAFNKQAFCNYYFFVIGGLCCAVAASDVRPKEEGRGSCRAGARSKYVARQEPRPPGSAIEYQGGRGGPPPTGEVT